MRVVLVRLSALGDIVHTWPLAVAIRSARPDVHLTWVVEEPLAPLVNDHPDVDAVMTAATGRWRKRPFSARTRAEAATLRGRFNELQPELTIDAQGTLKSAVVTRWTGSKRRIGLAKPWRRELVAGLAYTGTLAGHTDHPHVVATNLELVRAVDAAPPGDLDPPDGRWLAAKAAASTPHGPWSEPYGVLLPGAGMPGKILSPSTLADAARHLVASGMETVVAWGPSEENRAREVVELGGAGVHLAPPTDLMELSGLLGGAAVVLGGDTGPVHLAASFGVPTLAVFLVTNPDRNRPLGSRVGVVSGAAPGGGPGGSATTGRARAVSTSEIRDALDGLLARQD
jgi:heptosyltransferase-1